ncbi:MULTISPECIES: DUF3953 domain-containing protein [unclassified Bacillus (in: firmicutes)]|uniref:DUF3953 domain-containing protein n=1 Tax=unclassified Bacillus (in: firmicutes) TaxID=185979 RepID=UPI00032E50DC|nr:DUF3953 domain-containing protein [Bacillus wiedmannii]EOP14456.1 hypothetical protein ICS_00713 [Bacillus cereus BAG2O-3]EOQ08038.1 hypothetical protein KQ3_04140 [Bacillus cereus B5-2]MDA1602252.1 DUF3953 domain-containing protein [Bacillus cereus]PFW84550.1 DUF3953 domain-containing protein [Bacillus sp. AFS075960]RFB77816.1 DUF3953 domain-containing protein [Bacillus sp. AW]HDR8172972.1 DUF3953 domain-containing protein [Bacillus thuringiensis]
MLKTLRIISALIVIILALYGTFRNPIVTMPYMLIALSIMAFLISAEEKQKQKKVHSTLSFFSGIFTLIVAIVIIFSR